jgi:hypothetical protein
MNPDLHDGVVTVIDIVQSSFLKRLNSELIG